MSILYFEKCMITLLLLMTGMLLASYNLGVRHGGQLRQPLKRNVAVQSQSPYKRCRATPRFSLLPEGVSGAMIDN